MLNERAKADIESEWLLLAQEKTFILAIEKKSKVEDEFPFLSNEK